MSRPLSLPEFIEATGLAERTVRYWHEAGVVPQVAPGDAGYTPAHLRRARAALALKAQGVRRLAELAASLDAMSDAELRRLAGEPAEPEPLPAPAPGAATPSVRAVVAEHVEVALRDGLVLRVRRPYDEETRVLVRAIASFCGTKAELP